MGDLISPHILKKGEQMTTIASLTTNLNTSRALAIALPRFYERTNITTQISYIYRPENKNIEILFGFLPKEPTKEEYSILFEEILNAENLLINKYIVDSSVNFETLKQMVFKHKEDLRQIISKHKNENN